MIDGMTNEGDADWSVYILRCIDGTLYTGVTNNLEQRLTKHQDGKAAKYTRTRRPVELVYWENELTRSDALRREFALKRLSKDSKERIINDA